MVIKRENKKQKKVVKTLKILMKLSLDHNNYNFIKCKKKKKDNASKLFNNRPETIRNCKDYRTFLRLSRIFFNKQSTKRLVSFAVTGFR